MALISDAIITGIAWEAFSEYVNLGIETIEEITLSMYIANELRKLKQLEASSSEFIEETTEVIETAVLEIPEKIRQIENEDKQKEAFQKYIQEEPTIRNITTNNYIENIDNRGGTITFS